MLASNHHSMDMMSGNLLGGKLSAKKAPLKTKKVFKTKAFTAATVAATETLAAAATTAEKRKLPPEDDIADNPEKKRKDGPEAAAAFDLAAPVEESGEGVFKPTLFEECPVLVDDGLGLRNGQIYQKAILKCSGALIAPSKTNEGFKLRVGCQKTCLPDAVFHGLLTIDSSMKVSRDRLISSSVPELGNDLEATPKSVIKALEEQGVPYTLKEATQTYRVKGGAMKSLLCEAPGKVFAVVLYVQIGNASETKKNRHAVMLSTIAEEHCKYGKIIDNTKARPVYLEERDGASKPSAKRAWRKIVSQRFPENEYDVSVEVAEIWEIVPRA